MQNNIYSPLLKKILVFASKPEALTPIILENIGGNARNIYRSEENKDFSVSNKILEVGVSYPIYASFEKNDRPRWAMKKITLIFTVAPERICCIVSCRTRDRETGQEIAKISGSSVITSKTFPKFLFGNIGDRKVLKHYANYYSWIVNHSQGEDPLNLLRKGLPLDLEGSSLRAATVQKAEKLLSGQGISHQDGTRMHPEENFTAHTTTAHYREITM